MSMSDPIADLLTRIRNGLTVGNARVDIPCSGIKEQICAVLKNEGYIEAYTVVEGAHQATIQVRLKYQPNGKPVIQGIQRVSKPSLRVYTKSKSITYVRSGLGISIVTTPKGVMTGKQARAANVGGEVVCKVW